ncbi:MAG: cbb3-type cytochrome c oxidase N-terminal domain-containing protein [Candidatus Zixiibacteriota bacterium]
MAEYKEDLLDHDYDGIREMDNDLPKWWLYLFIFSIIFSVAYFAYYHVFSIGYLQDDEYQQELNPNYVRQSSADMKTLGILPEYRSPLYSINDEPTPRMKAMMKSGGAPRLIMTAATDTISYPTLTDPEGLREGKETYIKNCSQCHGKLGEGGVGPNLTDDYWIHGGDISSVVRSVKYGYPSKGMISWMGTLKEDQIIQTASFVKTLRGSNPPNARGPQGDLVSEK